jgi:hypothetical protein
MGKREAEAAGYRALTSRYYLPKEQWMLDRVLADMKRANVDHVLVKDPPGVAVWRRAPGAVGAVCSTAGKLRRAA